MVVAIPAGARSPNAVQSCAPTNSGQITGSVTFASGISATDVEVRAYTLDGTWVAVTNATAGTYALTGLLPGQYRVLMQHDTAVPTSVAPEWYPNVARFSQAQIVTVTAGGTVTGINGVLELGTTIQGNANFIGSVAVYDEDGVYLRPGIVQGFGSSGSFETPGLKAGGYKLFFEPFGVSQSSNGASAEWHSDKFTPQTADVITVTGAPGSRFLPDFFLEPGGELSGAVTDASTGLGLVGVSVNANRVITPGAIGALSYYGTGTDASGNYTLRGLMPGTYRIQYVATGYAAEFYNDQVSAASSQLVTITSRTSQVSGIDAALSATQILTGRVTDVSTGAALSNTTPLPFRINPEVEVSDNAGNLVGRWYTDDNGYYTATVRPGTYRVRTRVEGYQDEWWNDRLLFASSSPVVVSASSPTVGINFLLHPCNASRPTDPPGPATAIPMATATRTPAATASPTATRTPVATASPTATAQPTGGVTPRVRLPLVSR
jgi:Carboxypeptidase regulatory-like domain